MENIYLKNKDKSMCNGCEICTKVCPTNAIKMVEDQEGFFYPEIDKDKCINCNKCKNICSNYNTSLGNEKVYVAINKNEKELEESSSGGMFYILAKYVIEKNGVVFGVEYDENLKVRHNFYETLEECKRFQGSKYVRSDINDSYRKVEEFLKDDRYVLFTGTPCQCNALKTYLVKEYEKLILCDIICHANPSQKVFDKYKNEIENSRDKKIKMIYFRTKNNGWRNQTPIIEYMDNEKEEEKTFFSAFVKELINRPSCHSCVFASSNRVTDFSIGDFWGIEKVMPEVEDKDTGISLFMVNSKKASEVFDSVKEYINYKEVDKDLAFLYNHNKNVPMHKNREKFFNNLDKISVIDNMNQNIKVSFIRKVFRKCKSLLNKIKK